MLAFPNHTPKVVLPTLLFVSGHVITFISFILSNYAYWFNEFLDTSLEQDQFKGMYTVVSVVQVLMALYLVYWTSRVMIASYAIIMRYPTETVVNRVARYT